MKQRCIDCANFSPLDGAGKCSVKGYMTEATSIKQNSCGRFRPKREPEQHKQFQLRV